MNIEQLYDQAQNFLSQEKPKEAYKLLKRLDSSIPNHPGILYLLGVCQSQDGNKTNAVSTYARVIKLQPNFVEAYNNAGLDLAFLGRHEEAIQFFDEALKINPAFKEAAINRAGALVTLNKLTEAISHLESLLSKHPNCPAILTNIGLAFNAACKHEGALGYYEAALQLSPNDPKILGYKVSTFEALRRWDECINTYDQLPSNCSERHTLHNAKLLAQLKTNDWSALSLGAEKLEATLNPLTYLYCCQSLQSQARNAKIYAARFKIKPTIPPHKTSKIKIGYVSADFREHPVAYLTAGIFGAHDRTKFEIFCFSTVAVIAAEANITHRIKSSCDHFISIDQSTDSEAVEQIRSLNLDVAIDLGGYTASSRPNLFASRIAPIQISYLGFPGTMGARFIDYLIGDSVVTPNDLRPSYIEKIISLPDSFQSNDDLRHISPSINRHEHQIPEDSFVFACFNQSAKILPEIFGTWMNALQSLPNSVLWLIHECPSQEQNLKREAIDFGISPDRLIFGSRLPYADHLSRYSLVDLALDTSPFNGGTTTSDALWAGAPVLTLCGETFASRMAASLLNNLRLSELITYSTDEYATKMISLASNPKKLAHIRSSLHENKSTSPVFNTLRFTRHLETGLKIAVERSRTGQKPDNIVVPSLQP